MKTYTSSEYSIGFYAKNINIDNELIINAIDNSKIIGFIDKRKIADLIKIVNMAKISPIALCKDSIKNLYPENGIIKIFLNLQENKKFIVQPKHLKKFDFKESTITVGYGKSDSVGHDKHGYFLLSSNKQLLCVPVIRIHKG